ncbi:hypothetical protein H8356DRAFT_1039919 [Neocallimastix lanati (nom. inval.)]|nr:hypothetical protein H8356DRAFT_1039919 [Neocallimastix sp. JGI-2020a]
MSAAVKCLRFKEPEVVDYIVYKYTDSESTKEDEKEETEAKLNETNETEIEPDSKEGTLFSENIIKNSIEILNKDQNSRNIEKINKNENEDKNEGKHEDENENNNETLIKDNKSESIGSENINEKDNYNKSDGSNENRPYESTESFVIYKDGDSAIIEGNTRSQKAISDRNMERMQQSQKKILERKLVREKLRSQMNEKKKIKSPDEVSINGNDNLENKNKEDSINNEKIKLELRENPLTKSSSLSNSDENSDTIVNSNPNTLRIKSNDSSKITKEDEDVNKILKEVSETYFLEENSNINLDNILEILGQTEIDTIDDTVGMEVLETATHMNNYEHGAIFRLQYNNSNCIMKIIPFDPEKNNLDLNTNLDSNNNFENNQVSLKIILQEIIAMKILSCFHTSGEITLNKSEVNQVTSKNEDKKINNERKVLAFAQPEGMWICKGSKCQVLNYEFQNYQLNEFSQDQYFLVTLFNNEGEIVNSSNNLERSLDQIKSVLWQICYSLALAEEVLGFEHSELYPEYILIEDVPREELIYKLNEREIKKDNFGVKATILDYSRSRLEYNGKVYYSDLTSVCYDDPSKKRSSDDLKTVFNSTLYKVTPIVNRSSFADLIQSSVWIIQCDKEMMNWLYNNMLEFAIRVEYNIKSMKEALNDPFWDLSKENWEMKRKNLTNEYSINTDSDCIIL